MATGRDTSATFIQDQIIVEEMSEAEISSVPSAAIFILDLGDNGGVVAPTTVAELAGWIDSEVQAWSWLNTFSTGNHKAAIDSNLGALRSAQDVARQAVQHVASYPNSPAPQIPQLQSTIQETFVARRFPHSKSPLGRRVDEMRARDPLEATGYLYTKMVNAGSYQFDARDISSWRGFLTGLLEQAGLESIPGQVFEGALQSFSGVQATAERLLAEKTEAYSALHKDYVRLAAEVAATKTSQDEAFQQFIEVNQEGHDEALSAHKATMANLEQVFREKMKLRAPVEYWEERQSRHDARSKFLGWLTFGAMLTLALMIGGIAWWVLSGLSTDGKPEVWRVSVLVLVGVLGVWGVRLIVRMFLSHIHLATDAAERVVMVKTYLALLEGENVPSDEDRKLILQPLFRPASDGIVKDEGLPHPALDILTKLGSR